VAAVDLTAVAVAVTVEALALALASSMAPGAGCRVPMDSSSRAQSRAGPVRCCGATRSSSYRLGTCGAKRSPGIHAQPKSPGCMASTEFMQVLAAPVGVRHLDVQRPGRLGRRPHGHVITAGRRESVAVRFEYRDRRLGALAPVGCPRPQR